MKIGKLYMILDSVKMAIRGLSLEIREALVSNDPKYCERSSGEGGKPGLTAAESLLVRRDSLVNRAYDLQEFLDSLSSKVKIPSLGMTQRQASHALDRLDTMIGYYRGLLNTPISSPSVPISAEGISKGLMRLETERTKVASEFEQAIWTKEIVLDGFDDILNEFGDTDDLWSLPLVTITQDSELGTPPISAQMMSVGPAVQTVSQEVTVASPEDIAEVQARFAEVKAALTAIPSDPQGQQIPVPEEEDLSWFYDQQQSQEKRALPIEAPEFNPQHQGSMQQRLASHQVNQAEMPNLVMNPQAQLASAQTMGLPMNHAITHPRCPICNSQNRNVIEGFYLKSEQDMLSTLDFISSIDGHVLATIARSHFDDHVGR